MQSCQMLESQIGLICSNNHQDQPVIFVLLDEGIQSFERLKCPQCLISIRGKINGMSYQEAITKIQELKDQLFQENSTYINSKLNSLKNLQDHLENTKSLVMQKFEQIINHLDLWKRTLHELNQKFSTYSLLEEIDKINIPNQQLFQNEQRKFKEQIGELDNTFQKKAYFNLDTLRNSINEEQINILMNNIIQRNEENQFENLQQSNQLLINSNQYLEISDQKKIIFQKDSNQHSEIQVSSIQQSIIPQEDTNQKSDIQDSLQLQYINTSEINEKPEKKAYKLISSVQQKEICTGLAINKDGSLIAASCNNDIKVWKFKDGNLIDQKILLKGHEGIKIDWFVSGGMDNSLRCWIDRNKKYWFSSHSWEGSKAYTQHTNSILCLLLNEEEDELISSSSDHSIKIWNVKSKDNSIEYKYSLNKHSNQVFQISLNSTNTEMVSCSEDRIIIMWGKDATNQWEFKYIINKDVDDYGLRINFCFDDAIIWCQNSKPIAHVFILENGIFQHKPHLSIKLKPLADYDYGSDYCFFPSKYNSKTRTLILKQNKYIYRIKKSMNNQFYIDGDGIVNSVASCYGTIQDDQNYIVIWNKELLQMQVYEACEK
ncbi:unnamed protein product [Paramecium pentaurelia]|uniref:WD40-repeat-containing domain n=1 Tax=Paramecium pentaurelia TaxID=43138 RepID=A0A8S1V8D0_9CILI|nr:unnamed protein product [Paramecium pentaurelia]